VQFIDLLHHLGEADTAAAVVAHVVEDAAETLGQGVAAQPLDGVAAGELEPEFAIDEFQHVVGVVGVAGPAAPGIGAGQAACIGGVVESGFLFLAGLGFVEGFQEEQPGQLFDVVAGVHAFGVELVAGVLDDLLNFLASVVDALSHGGSGVRGGPRQAVMGT